MNKEDFMDYAIIAILSNSHENVATLTYEAMWRIASDAWKSRPLPTKPDIKATLERSKRFTKPTLAEVSAYIKEKGYKTFTASKWYDFYDSKGWKIGNSPMKSWEASVRTWGQKESDDKQKSIGFA